ncbi:MAG: polysaccharide biosynthesis/export family protein [Paracoccaceae bacterium]
MIFRALSLCLLLAACGSTGPRVDAILGDKDAVTVKTRDDRPYAVIQVDSTVAALASNLNEASESLSFLPDQGAAPIAIGVGDSVQVAIVSTSDGGFLDITNSSLAPISTTALPPQQVGTDGMISVPPIGRVRAAGNSVQGFERFLTRRLGEVLVSPTAIVNLVDRQSAQVTLVGNIGAPGTYSINQNSKHLTDVIALAGGPTAQPEDIRVVMSRGNRTASARLVDIYENPELQIHLQAGDIIRFEPLDYDFTVLGAGGTNANFTVLESGRTLVKALGTARGLQQGRGDPRGVFVYRLIPRSDAVALGVDTSPFSGDTVPAIFQFNMKEPQALFVAQAFDLANDDILYVSTSTISEINGFFSAFNLFIPTPREVVD